MGGEEMSQESLKLRRSNERRLQMAHARGVARHIALLGASRSRKGSRHVPAPNRAAGASPRKCTAPTVTPKPMPSATSAPAGRNDPIPSVAAPTAGRSATADRSAATRRRQDSTSVVSLLVSLAVSLNARGGGVHAASGMRAATWHAWDTHRQECGEWQSTASHRTASHHRSIAPRSIAPHSTASPHTASHRTTEHSTR